MFLVRKKGKMNNFDTWFGKGSNMAADNQIYARLDYLKKEKENLGPFSIGYELGVLSNLVNSIPFEDSKQAYKKIVKEKLKELKISDCGLF